MPDRSFRHVFAVVEAEPSDAFATATLALLLAELASPVSVGAFAADDLEEDSSMPQTIDPIGAAPAPRSPARRLLPWIGLAAAALVIGLVLVSRDGDSEPAVTIPPSPTTVPPTPSSTAAATTVAAPRTTLLSAASLPLVSIPPGTYAVPQFVVPFELTTTGTWTRVYSRPDLVAFRRGEIELYVTSGVMPGATPQAALAALCSGGGKAEFGPTTAGTLLGAPSVQLDATAGQPLCNVMAIDTAIQVDFVAGHVFRVVAADVGGTVVVVAIDAPADAWTELGPEIDALIASMRSTG